MHKPPDASAAPIQELNVRLFIVAGFLQTIIRLGIKVQGVLRGGFEWGSAG